MPDANARLPLKSISWLTLLNLAAAGVGLLQTIAITWLFGATRTVEIFFAATTFQYFLLQLVNSGQIGDLFTPIYHDIEAQYGMRSARAAFAAMTNVMLLGAIVIALTAALLAQPIADLLVPGFSEADRLLTSRVFVVVAPLIVLLIINSMYSNLLRAEHRYGVAEVLALISRIVNLAVLVGLASALGIWAMILGLWISALIHLVGQCWWVHRSGPGHSFRLSTEQFRPRTVLVKLPLTFTHILSAQFFAFAFTANLSMLPEGSLAVYNYAQRLRGKFQGLVLQPIGIVFFNHLSQSLSRAATNVRKYAEQALSLTLAMTSFCFVPIAAGGDLLLAGLWQSEAFPPARIEQSYWILCVLTGLLVFNSQYLITRRTNLALKLVGRQYAATGTVVMFAALSCYWVIPKFGLLGAVAVQVVVAFANTAASVTVLASKRRDLVCLLPLNKLCRWAVAIVISISFAWLIRGFLPTQNSLERPAQIVIGTVLSAAGLFSLAALSLAFRIPEAQEIFGKLRAKLNRGNHVRANL